MTTDGGYSEVADEQLDTLEQGPDMDPFNAALDACKLVFQATSMARARSTAVIAEHGIVFRLPVVGHPPYTVFWAQTPDGPRIEAAFPHP